jgi:hypothetical protein
MVRLSDADPRILRAYAETERTRALHYHGAWRRFAPVDDPRAQLLAEGLRHRALRHAEHAVHAVAPLGDHEAIDVALETVTSRDPNQRAYALDTVESLTDQDLVRPLLAIWEPVAASKPADASTVRPLLSEDDPWIRACAALAAGALGVGDGADREAIASLARGIRTPSCGRPPRRPCGRMMGPWRPCRCSRSWIG